MKQTPGQRPFKDERDEQIDTHSKSAALDFVIAATQILTIMCLIKGNPHGKAALRFCLSEGPQDCFTNMISTRKSHIFRLVLLLGLLVQLYSSGLESPDNCNSSAD